MASNLRDLMPGLPPSFIGTVVISAPNEFVAWTLNSIDGVLSSLPPGQAGAPIAQADRILLAFAKIVNAARPFAASAFGVDLFNPVVGLQIDSSQQINASAGSDGRLTVSLALAELIADSPSELGFLIAHELAHVIQQRAGRSSLLNADRELDADILGLLFSLGAGYDPYGAAGALGKLSMASGTSGAAAQSFLNEFEAGSPGARLQNLYNGLKFICNDSAFSQACVNYRAIFHPHFPPSVPLSIEGARPVREVQPASLPPLTPVEVKRPEAP